MYGLVILLTMVVLPLASVVLEGLFGTGQIHWLLLAGKWFVFWTVGVRLLMAGLRQAIGPAFTADMLSIKEPASYIVIQELGFANLALGSLGLLAIFNAEWIIPGAVAGGLFLGMAGLKHTLRAERSAKENIAMASDLWAAALLVAFLVAGLVGLR